MSAASPSGLRLVAAGSVTTSRTGSSTDARLDARRRRRSSFRVLRVRASTDADRRVEQGVSRVRPSAGRLVPHPGMAFVAAGAFTMGSDTAFPEEAPASTQNVGEFWIDRTEVTNAQFAEFVAATGYVTLAERGVRTAAALDAPVVAGSAVFAPDADKLSASPRNAEYWWRFVSGASWRPLRPGVVPRGPCTTPRGAHRLRGCARLCTVAWAQATDRGAVRIRGADELAPQCGGPARSEHVAGSLSDFERSGGRPWAPRPLRAMSRTRWGSTTSWVTYGSGLRARTTRATNSPRRLRIPKASIRHNPTKPSPCSRAGRSSARPTTACVSATGAHRPEQRAWCVAHRFSHGAQSVTT